MNFAAPITICSQTRAEVVALRAIPVAWDSAWIDLACHASEPNPFAEHWFMRPAVDHLAQNIDARMIAIWRGPTLLGMLPVTIAAKYGRIPLRHAENWLHYHCFYGAPLVRAEAEAEFWVATLGALDQAHWAPHFLHLVGLDPSSASHAGLQAARRTDVVHRSERAMLRSSLDPEAYLAAHVRPKKRKELRRLKARLDELGFVAFEALSPDDNVALWIADFLALEASGWKGREGTALQDSPDTKAFFVEAISGAFQAGKLEMLRLTLNGNVIAMLVNFITPPGAFAFKIAFDEAYARFSPGVLIKIENLKVLDRADIEWTDSCAVENHQMINSLWAERREVVRITVPLAGAARHLVFRAARSAETLSAAFRGRW